MLNRRKFIGLVATASAIGLYPSSASGRPADRSVGFGFSLYGMKNVPLLDALRRCAEVGYDCVELPTMPDWRGAPEGFAPLERKRFRDALVEHSLRLSALMENLVLVAAPELHAKNLDRLRAAAELGHELSPTGPIIIETVMGGNPAEWLAVRDSMAERLSAWAKVGEATQSTIAIKAHIGGAANRPEHVRWLLEKVQSPSLKAVFDFSHFQLRGIDLSESWNTLAADAVFIHIKDATGNPQKFQFSLPGTGSIDYTEYLKLIRDAGYAGDIVVEVSGQLHSRPDYDPMAACNQSYSIAPIFHRVGLKRR